jgi:hypothetical protein
MQEQTLAWIDVISPVLTFAVVIVAPSIAALWVIYHTLFNSSDDNVSDSHEA